MNREGWRPIALGTGWKYRDNENIILPTSRYDASGAGWRIWTDAESEKVLGLDPFFTDLEQAMRVVESLTEEPAYWGLPSPNDPDTEWSPPVRDTFHIGGARYRV